MHLKNLHLLPLLACALIVGACASIGRPEGGPIDEDPPVFVRSTPMPGALHATATDIAIYFDENVQLEDAFSKVLFAGLRFTLAGLLTILFACCQEKHLVRPRADQLPRIALLGVAVPVFMELTQMAVDVLR